MRIDWARLALSGMLAAPLIGCAAVDPRPDFRRVDQHVAAAIGDSALEPPEDAATAQRMIDERLRDGLTAEEALQICLMNNPRVRAAYLRVGVARADVVQAGLFSNPSLALSLRMPDGGGLTNLQFDVAQNIADLWLIPARTRAAQGDLDRATREVAREVSAAALDTRIAYFTAIGADQELEIVSENRALAEQLVEAARARRTAGVGSEIDVNLAAAELMQTEVRAQTATISAFEARRQLCVLLGLMDSPTELELRDRLPDPPAGDFDVPALVRAAEVSRLDLVAADYLIAAAAARVEQEKRSVVSDVQVGVSFERVERGRRGDRDFLADTLWASAQAGALAAPSLQPRGDQPTESVLGPSLSLKVPIFDQNQAQIAKAELIHQTMMASRGALLVEVTHETRAAAQRAAATSALLTYYDDNFLPLAQRNLDLSRAAYREGALSLLSVLEAQKALLAARSQAIQTRRDYIVALIDLEKAVGLPIDRMPGRGADRPMTRSPAANNPETSE